MEPRKSFDINAPSRYNPSATSRPVIVGHRPIMTDPMMRPPMPTAQPSPAHVAKVVEVTQEIKDDLATVQPQSVATPLAAEFPQTQADSAPPETAAPQAPATPSAAPSVVAASATVPPTNPPAADQALSVMPQQDLTHIPHVSVSHRHHKGGAKNLVLWLLIAGFLLAFAAYLLADAGFIGGASHLPFRIFNQN